MLAPKILLLLTDKSAFSAGVVSFSSKPPEISILTLLSAGLADVLTPLPPLSVSVCPKVFVKDPVSAATSKFTILVSKLSVTLVSLLTTLSPVDPKIVLSGY